MGVRKSALTTNNLVMPSTLSLRGLAGEHSWPAVFADQRPYALNLSFALANVDATTVDCDVSNIAPQCCATHRLVDLSRALSMGTG